MAWAQQHSEADEFLDKVNDTYQKVQDLISGKTSVLESLREEEEREKIAKAKDPRQGCNLLLVVFSDQALERAQALKRLSIRALQGSSAGALGHSKRK